MCCPGPLHLARDLHPLVGSDVIQLTIGDSLLRCRVTSCDESIGFVAQEGGSEAESGLEHVLLLPGAPLARHILPVDLLH